MTPNFGKYIFVVYFLITGSVQVELSDSDVRYIASLTNASYTNYVLDKIVVPRVVGTPDHEKVFQFIKSELESLKWTIDVDEFQKDTEIGRLTFKTIIATLNPNAQTFLVLGAHYDTLYIKDEVFVGATDGAVPCSMLLNLAKVMRHAFNQFKRNNEVSLKLIFFDGGEDFGDEATSNYGSRHLADKYSKETTEDGETEIERIKLLIVWSLIGHKDITFYWYLKNTESWYMKLSDAEDRLSKLGLTVEHSKYFLREQSFEDIEDDHTAFVKKGVVGLDLIANPFPKQWHTPADKRDIVDPDAVENLNTILRIFVAEYFPVRIFHI